MQYLPRGISQSQQYKPQFGDSVKQRGIMGVDVVIIKSVLVYSGMDKVLEFNFCTI